MSESPQHRGRRIEVETRTSAPPERIWAAWADPDRLAGWFPDRAAGRAEPGAQLTWHFDDFGLKQVCEVVAAVPGERLALLTPRGPETPPQLLEITIAVEEGTTRVRLVHSGFAEDSDRDEEYEGVRSGWRMALALMREYVERHFGRRRHGFLAMRAARYEPHALRPCFRDEAGLARWLTRTGSIGAPGDRVRLALRDGGTLTGAVLEDTGRELALRWEEMDGAIELKAFTGPDGPMVGIRGSSWSEDPDRIAAAGARMGDALDRLTAALDGSA